MDNTAPPSAPHEPKDYSDRPCTHPFGPPWRESDGTTQVSGPCYLGDRRRYQRQCAIGSDPAVAHDLQPAFAGNAATETIRGVRQSVLMQRSGHAKSGREGEAGREEGSDAAIGQEGDEQAREGADQRPGNWEHRHGVDQWHRPLCRREWQAGEESEACNQFCARLSPRLRFASLPCFVAHVASPSLSAP